MRHSSDGGDPPAPPATRSGSGSGAGSASEIELRAFLRPIGTPLPLGFLGLAGATTALAGLQLGWFPVLEWPHVGLVVVAFAVPLQLLASVYGFLARDAVAGTGMGVLAGTWLAIGLVMLNSLPGSTSGALGVLLIAAAVCLLVPLLSARASKLAASAVLGMAAIRFAVTGVYLLTAEAAWKTAAGVCGVVLAAIAVCAALAFESESGPGRTLLPTLRTGAGRRQMTAPPERANIGHEPGVRPTL
ncbi:hypothetical protein MMF93_04700 [Streptomyces tubbatahanensis]|uniref:Integral membrane protein n=1 Tax=Streptomyces tubbatahanensis TaxID=2923272 RepID=A0ABY3XN75_9ACTN|nr:hypothetical protein [Streptomyces tubbatahanensis]UNS95871.1 hypothetical protein MMF93_04700 [Streptomyces tubbatahanensis]